MGEASLWIGLNLRQTTSIIDDLCQRNLVRLARDEELSSTQQRGYAYTLTCPQLIPSGAWDDIPAELLGDPPLDLV